MTLKYFNELKKSMTYMSNSNKSVFIGQAVEVQGTAMYKTLLNVDKKKKIELPVAEEMQMGITIGMLMKGYTPISIYPRFNFLILAMNQLVNHLDKLDEMTGGYYKSKAIIRTSIGSIKPLNPQSQHTGDYTSAIKKMCKNINVVKLTSPNQIFTEYKKAFSRKDRVSTILVEYGDYYNTK
jgi:pyruvate/2-oxoglutarate/acetoin dehydrogenase E1 component